MANKIKTGKIEIPDEDFKDENITAHISIRLPLNMLKELKHLALTEQYEGRYQVLMRDILADYIQRSTFPKKEKVG
jgi:metal-responsive CopG/Arc/MetJ family transcriptional regulator